MSNFFKPEDIKIDFNRYVRNSEEANELMRDILSCVNKKIETMPFVYSKLGDDFPKWHLVNFTGSTHKARLAFITKSPCQHIAGSITMVNNELKTNCHNCGVELKATWSEK